MNAYGKAALINAVTLSVISVVLLPNAVTLVTMTRNTRAPIMPRSIDVAPH